MLWVKAFHIVFVASWFAGLFYLPRIFVNLQMVAPGSVAERDRLLLMDGGALVADGAPMDVLTPERLASVYGVAARIDVNDGLPLIVPTARV